ncbi:hypothetical protein H6G97_30525 [Nostoc flagelliforme FACHB-838]|uniref:Uncharacterized protein n=1 Tax=Nostoc flagelliforme FACHB-838 TaxID=2692904 RepID=A0ABR8DZ46_9NOSO|nr:hypothetical protein [Nostoc flagelliforme]MBD2533654.1 hypothetical protein [Nostoc flagelliforme FACHB-838]
MKRLFTAKQSCLAYDAGKPRNQVAHAAHGFFSRDGISPVQLLQIGREQLHPYDDVEIQVGEVVEDLAVSVLTQQKYTVRVSDLYQINWKAIADEQDFLHLLQRGEVTDNRSLPQKTAGV